MTAIQAGQRETAEEQVARNFPTLDRKAWSVARLWLAVYLLGFAQWPDVRMIADIPGTFFNPPYPLSSLITQMLPLGVGAVTAIHIAGIVSIVLFGAGVRWGWLMVTVWMIVAHSLIFGLGKVDHTYTPWLIPALGAGSRWGREDPPWSALATKATVAVTLACAWITAGLPKLVRGWLSLGDQRVAEILVDHDLGVFGARFATMPWPVMEAVDWTVVIGEFCLAPLILFSSTRLHALRAMVVFHIVILLVLNISYDGVLGIYLFLGLQFGAHDKFTWFHQTRTVVWGLVGLGLWRVLTTEDRLQLELAGWTNDPAWWGAIGALSAALFILCWPKFVTPSSKPDTLNPEGPSN